MTGQENIHEHVKFFDTLSAAAGSGIRCNSVHCQDLLILQYPLTFCPEPTTIPLILFY
jgi:hypothetical protein